MCSNSCNWIVNFYPPTLIIEVEQLVFVFHIKVEGLL
jgi:hypothetical protein